ncbi:MAG: toll/interleukin-1 receptor domain-containing protein, partial [Cyanobacteria bacterium J06635_11]
MVTGQAESQFDVFMCHNSEDKPAVKDLATRLIEQGIRPWLDEWELRPGLDWQDALDAQIKQIKTAAVFVGEAGIGPWQNQEIQSFLSEFVERGCPVIPVLLPNAVKEPELPRFLRGKTFVDFRKQIPEPFGRLVWGITGVKPAEIPSAPAGFDNAGSAEKRVASVITTRDIAKATDF